MRTQVSGITHLANLLTGLATQDGSQSSRLDGVRLLRYSSSKPCAPHLYTPSLIFVAQGCKKGYLGDKVFEYDPHNFLVLSVPLPLECEVVTASEKKPLLGMSLQVNAAVLAELLADLDPPPTGKVVPGSIYSAPFDERLREAVIRLAECLYSPADCRILGAGIVREIFYRVLESERGGALQAAASPHSQFGRMSKALRRIHTEYAMPLNMATLARDAHMSVSAFHHKFKAMTSTSPLQYLKKVRLHKARILMVQDGIRSRTAAEKVGYGNPAYFSREFNKFFQKKASPLAGKRTNTSPRGRNKGALSTE